MIFHTILYVILSVLSATAVFAASMPIGKDSAEQHQPREDNRESGNDL